MIVRFFSRQFFCVPLTLVFQAEALRRRSASKGRFEIDVLMTALGCQPDYIWNYLKPKWLGTPVRHFLNSSEVDGPIQVFCVEMSILNGPHLEAA